MSKLGALTTLGTLALGIVVACGSSDSSGFDDGSGDAGASSSSGSSGSSGASSGSLGSSSGSSGNDSGLDKCASETQDAQQRPLDLLIMLDASGSMMDTASGNTTKWAAVKTALSGFINDAKSAGIGVGFQIFPIEHAGAPSSCVTSADCNVGGTSYGHCFTKVCQPPNTTSPIMAACDSSADCPGNAPCVQLGYCKQGIFNLGDCLVGVNGFGCGIGTCTAVPQANCDGTECFASDYQAVKVGIATLPGNANALTTTMNAIPNPPPNALTPTSKAIEGGLAYAKAYAQANPTHVVVMVLATDGLPTRCAPMDIPGIAAIASAGANGTPGVKTFVIGVFSQNDVTAGAPANLDGIAAGGGTGKAFIVNTTNNVTTQFQAALDTIRGSALPCDYNVPVPEAGTPDFGKVNVQYTTSSGTTVLPYKTASANCDPTNGGWYYDADPSTGGTPTKITLCPATCDSVKKASGAAKVEVVLGCKTIVQ